MREMRCDRVKNPDCPPVEINLCGNESADKNGATFRGWEYAREGDYHKRMDPNWSYTPTYLSKMPYIRGFLSGLPEEVRILNAGCGEGVVVEEFKKKGYGIEGIDLNYASSYVKQGNILDMKTLYEDEHFDAVLLLDVFEHLAFADQSMAFKEIKRILRPGGGDFLVSIPTLAHWNSRFQFALHGNLDRSDIELNHVGERPIKENMKLLNDVSFQIEKTVGITLTVPFLYRRVICRRPSKFRWLHDLMEHIAVPSLSMLNLFWCRK